MKKQWIPIVCLSLSLPVFGLAPGDEVTLASLAEAEVIQGEVPAAWNTGDLYILECWATWCAPCLAAIPHMDALDDKYRNKGLRVIGVNVWEDGKEKVAKFVEKKADGMSYPVVYVGKGGDFEGAWLKAAAVTGIPCAFVIKNGRLLFTAHPGALTEEIVEVLLAGGDQESAVIEKISADEKQRAMKAQISQAFFKAKAEKDAAGMAEAIRKTEETDPKNPKLLSMRADLVVLSKDWDKAEKMLAAAPEPSISLQTAYCLLESIDNIEAVGVPLELQQMLIDTLNGIEDQEPVALALVARMQWRLGQKDQAKATAEKAARLQSNEWGCKPFKTFAESFEGGKEPMSMQQLMELIRTG